MDTGTNQPEFPNEANQPNESNKPNQGPSGNRNRRRRRRGGRRGQQGSQQNARPQNSGQGQGQQHGFRGQGQFGGRRNNQQNRRGQGGQNRRRRGRGAAPFVGPMDHSYRNANGGGNFNGVANGRYRTPGFQQPYPVESELQPISGKEESSANKIVCFVDDLFFLAKIQEVARKLGVKVEFAKADKESLDRITESEEKPALIIFDLNNANAKPLTTIPKLRSKLKKGTSIVGFLSHLQGDLKMKAQEAGCDMVVPRSAFSQNLPALLRRHSGVDELTNEGM